MKHQVYLQSTASTISSACLHAEQKQVAYCDNFGFIISTIVVSRHYDIGQIFLSGQETSVISARQVTQTCLSAVTSLTVAMCCHAVV